MALRLEGVTPMLSRRCSICFALSPASMSRRVFSVAT